MKMTNILYLVSVLILAGLAVSAVNAQMHEIDYNASKSTLDSSNLIVTVLKYEPYPVNAGDWFDVWIKVQNNGEADAKNVTFELKSDYPFYSNDSLVRNYGIIPGTINAYKTGMSGDANEVILKYRVKTADNAPEGDSDLKVGISNSGFEIIESLPITIGKTKTDFDVVMQDSTSQGASFAIANIGDNAATAVTVSIPEQGNVLVTGAQSSIIGNLAKGDFTTVTFQIAPNKALHTLSMQIAYTDTAGIRNVIEKNLTVNMNNAVGNFTNNGTSRSTGSGLATYAFAAGGFALGAIAVFAYNKFKKKK